MKSKTNWTPAIILGLLAAWAITFAALVMDRKDGSAQSGEGARVSDRIYHWKMVTTWPKNTPGVGVSAEKLAVIVDEMSNGRLKIHVHGAGELVPAMGFLRLYPVAVWRWGTQLPTIGEVKPHRQGFSRPCRLE